MKKKRLQMQDQRLRLELERIDAQREADDALTWWNGEPCRAQIVRGSPGWGHRSLNIDRVVEAY